MRLEVGPYPQAKSPCHFVIQVARCVDYWMAQVRNPGRYLMNVVNEGWKGPRGVGIFKNRLYRGLTIASFIAPSRLTYGYPPYNRCRAPGDN